MVRPTSEPAEETTMRQGAVPWHPWPYLLMLWGIPGTLVALAFWFENLEEEGGLFFSAVLATLGALMFAVAAVGVIAQGVRLGIAWARHDERGLQDDRDRP